MTGTLRAAHAALFVVAIAVIGLAARVPGAANQQSLPSGSPAGSWFKGNLHTHTLNSDGDSPANEVVTWYREHGYQFLVLTDHNFLTSVQGLNALHGADGKFLVVKGEEVTDRLGDKPLHVNGLEVESLVMPPGGGTVVERVQGMVDAVRKKNGVPSINHPNFEWAITPDEFGQLQRTRLFEVWNGHPTVNNLGGGGVPGLEDTWDRVLSSGKLLYGIAVDDAHTFKQPGNPLVAGPGRAAGGSTSVRRVWSHARWSRRSSAVTSTRRRAWSWSQLMRRRPGWL